MQPNLAARVDSLASARVISAPGTTFHFCCGKRRRGVHSRGYGPLSRHAGRRGRYNGRQVLSQAALDLSHSPPQGLASDYGMGWLNGEVQGVRTIEHNGILSTWYAEAVLLPGSGYGFVVLTNEYALTSAALAFPRLKTGLVALLSDQAPPSEGLTVPQLGGLLGAIFLLIGTLALRGLFRLPHWRQAAVTRPAWRQFAGVALPLVPGALTLALPRLLASGSGRYFGYVMLARAMPEILIGLVLWSAVGVVTSVLRGAALRRRPHRSRS